MHEQKIKKGTRESPNLPVWIRVVQYEIIVMSCFITALFMQSSDFSLFLVNQLVWAFIFYALINVPFLTVYMTRYHAYAYAYTSKKALKWALSFFLIVMSVLLYLFFYTSLFNQYISFALMLNLLHAALGSLYLVIADQEDLQKVRHELIWPSLFTIAGSCYAGYIFFRSVHYAPTEWHSFLPLAIPAFYYFLALIDWLNKHHTAVTGIKHRSWERMFMFLAPSSIFGMMCFFQEFLTLFLFILFASHSAILEAWEIITRQKEDRNVETYVIAINTATAIGMTLTIFFFAFSSYQASALVSFVALSMLIIWFWLAKQDRFNSTTKIVVPKILFFYSSCVVLILTAYPDIHILAFVNNYANILLFEFRSFSALLGKNADKVMAAMTLMLGIITLYFQYSDVNRKKKNSVPDSTPKSDLIARLVNYKNYKTRGNLPVQLSWFALLCMSITLGIYFFSSHDNALLTIMAYLIYIVFYRLIPYVNTRFREELSSREEEDINHGT